MLATLLVLMCTRTAAAMSAREPEAADYVIVGGGTAGCVVAARLCARFRDARILLLERGQERNATEEEHVRAVRSPPFPPLTRYTPDDLCLECAWTCRCAAATLNPARNCLH